jgi:hypothetical protein
LARANSGASLKKVLSAAADCSGKNALDSEHVTKAEADARAAVLVRETGALALVWGPGQDDDHDHGHVEDPKVIKKNALDTIADHKAVAEAYRKIFKKVSEVSRLEYGDRIEIRNAIELLILKWKNALSAIPTDADYINAGAQLSPKEAGRLDWTEEAGPRWVEAWLEIPMSVVPCRVFGRSPISFANEA